MQFVTAPIAAALDQRYDERYLTAFGFLVFGIRVAMNCIQTSATDYHQMFWPQVVRGLAVMFCILPPTRLALGHLAKADIPDASGLFNMMRNLGGAIGIRPSIPSSIAALRFMPANSGSGLPPAISTCRRRLA